MLALTTPFILAYAASEALARTATGKSRQPDNTTSRVQAPPSDANSTTSAEIPPPGGKHFPSP
ncbi:hypothetical protein [Aeromonas enterica]|jgi:hypothetical protein